MFKRSLIYSLLLTFIISVTGYCSVKAASHAASKKSNTLTFYVATDIHYLSNRLTDDGKAFDEFVASGDGKQLKYIDQLTNAFVMEIKKKKPDFLIVSGDLTNNGERASHVDLAQKFAEIELSGIKVYVIPGNHDIFNPYARGFKGNNQYETPYISDKDFSNIYRNFGYNTALSRDKASLSYLAAPSNKLWLLMLDTNKYEDNEVLGFPEVGGQLKPDTIEWIKKCSSMAKTKGAQLITVMHHNLIDHYSMLSKDYTIDDNANVLKLFRDNHLYVNLSGHIHIQDIKSSQLGDKTNYDIVTSAMSVYPHHYGVMTYSSDEGLNYSTASVPVEAWAKENKTKDKNLLDFDNYSKAAFKKSAYDKAYNRLIDSKSYTKAQLSQMADTMAEVNLRIFSGTENLEPEEITSSPGYKLWQGATSNFLQSYILSISNNRTNIDNNKLFIPISMLK